MILEWRGRALLLFLSFSVRLLAQAGGAQAETPNHREVTLDQYRAELQLLEERLPRLEASPELTGSVLAAIPDYFSVRDGERRYDCGNAWAKDTLVLLPGASSGRRTVILGELQEAVSRRLRDADALASTNRGADARASSVAAHILATKEFRRVRKPEFWQQWLNTILHAIVRFLYRLSDRTGRISWLGKTFVWASIAGACLGLSFWFYRLLRRPSEAESVRVPVPFSGMGRSWRRWLEEAHRAAARGEYREAMHLAYWTAIFRLEEAGAWRADRTRTPREYLEILSTASRRHQELKQLTRSFELAWYGNRPAGGAEFARAIQAIEALAAR